MSCSLWRGMLGLPSQSAEAVRKRDSLTVLKVSAPLLAESKKIDPAGNGEVDMAKVHNERAFSHSLGDHQQMCWSTPYNRRCVSYFCCPTNTSICSD